MIYLSQYVGKWSTSEDWNTERQDNANKLLDAANKLMDCMSAYGIDFLINPTTNSNVSGQTLGGFRPQSCTIGAPLSNHKEGLAIDIHDPINAIDNWLLQNQDKLEQFGIYIEAPTSTIGWSHWSIKPPKSGRHVFQP